MWEARWKLDWRGGLQLQNPEWNFEIFEVNSIQRFCKKVETRVHIERWGEM